MLHGKPGPRINHVERGVGGSELLGISSQVAANIQAGSWVWTGGDCSCSYGAVVGSAGAAANGFDPRCGDLPVPHPVVVHDGHGGRHIHDDYFIFFSCSVFTWKPRNQHDVYWLPISEPCSIVVERGIFLSKDIAGYILGNLNRNLYIVTTKLPRAVLANLESKVFSLGNLYP